MNIIITPNVYAIIRNDNAFVSVHKGKNYLDSSFHNSDSVSKWAVIPFCVINRMYNIRLMPNTKKGISELHNEWRLML